jgi:hypothetical protein
MSMSVEALTYAGAGGRVAQVACRRGGAVAGGGASGPTGRAFSFFRKKLFTKSFLRLSAKAPSPVQWR